MVARALLLRIYYLALVLVVEAGACGRPDLSLDRHNRRHHLRIITRLVGLWVSYVNKFPMEKPIIHMVGIWASYGNTHNPPGWVMGFLWKS